MPAFWKSLLGSSSKGSVEGDGGSIGSRRRQLDAHGSGHSSHRSQSNHLDGPSSSTASASGSVSAASLASTSSSSIMNSAGAATSTRSSKPHKPINAHSSSSSSSSSSNLGPVPITSFTSVPKSAVATTTSPDEEDDEDAIPSTPYSSGHSPSHARHRFPVPTKQHSVDEPDEPETFDATTSASSSNIVAKNTGSVASDLSKAGSFSPATSNQPPIHVSAVPQQPSQQQRLTKPDIPTTQTILANPLPQSSSGLAAAISSVLPSSNSHTSSMTPNGKGAYANDTGPRTFDIDDMIFRLLEAGYNGKLTKAVCLKNTEITAICSAAREVFLSQPTLIELSPPVKIVGDVHGQYSDLIRLFEMCGFPPKANYLFLGDYVDRGKQSLETILLLLCYKVKYPENFFLLRGNHECANVTRVYGFYDECKRRCNIKIWKTFIDVFNCLPITSLVAGKIFCVHGGLSPSLSSMDDIRRISRPTDVPDYGLLNDLLWSDPSDTALDWEDNERGVSYCFGKAVIQDFLAKYDFDLICRAHMVVEDGYEFWNERTLVTIFSAPNYCGEFDNFASVMLVNEDLLCAFELLKPLDGPALKKELLKCKRKNSAALAAGTSILS